jgi:hypothetical protein
MQCIASTKTDKQNKNGIAFDVVIAAAMNWLLLWTAASLFFSLRP